MSGKVSPSRRRLLKAGLTAAAGAVLPVWSVTKGAPAIIAAESERPQALQGLQLGDPSDGSIVVWSRSDRPARMLVEWSYDEQFRFDGFWEFVAGPLNAGTFGPNVLDGTFGPQLVFSKTPPAGQSNLSPYSGMQFFGEVNLNPTGEMTVDLRDINGVSVFRRRLQPQSF